MNKQQKEKLDKKIRDLEIRLTDLSLSIHAVDDRLTTVRHNLQMEISTSKIQKNSFWNHFITIRSLIIASGVTFLVFLGAVLEHSETIFPWWTIVAIGIVAAVLFAVKGWAKE